MTPDALRTAISGEQTRGVHGPQRGPVSITQVTELGGVYGLNELQSLTAVAHEFDLPVHLDGARFANALVALDCSPAEMTWKAGVDVVSFGGTKNGCMGVEAVIFFDPTKAWEFELRRKRGAHLASKHRYLSAQMEAYLDGNLWHELASLANASGQRLADGLRGHNTASLLFEPQANMIFAELPRRDHKKVQDAGAHYYVWNGDPQTGDPDQPLIGRFVTDWSMTHDAVDQFLQALRS
jgi:threonine aldolase